MKKMLKFIVIQLLVLVMPFTVFMNHVHAEDVGQWSSNYKLWSQGASKWSGVREVGCWIVAMSEMIYESGVDTSPEFNPDVFAEWEVANGELLNLTTNLYQQHLHGEGRAPVLYAEQKGVVLGYLGKMENPITDEQLWANINAGIFTIIFVTNSHTSNHYVLVDNDYSLATNELYVYESMPGAVECGSVPLSNYNRGQSYSYKREDTEQPVISDLLETNFTDNGLQIRFTAEDNWKVTKYGAVVQTAGKDLINDGVDVPGEYDYEKGDIKVDIDLTQLGLGTDVKLVNIKWYAEDKAGNKVYKINQKAHNLYAAVKDESIEGTYEAVADVKIRRAPYENIEGWDTWIGTLKRGEKVSVSGVYHNHYDHDWYKIDDEKWIYSENLRKASNYSVFEDIIKFIKNGLEFFWVGRFPVVKTVTTEVSAREYFSGNAVPEQGSYAIVEGTPYAQTINPDGSVTNVEYQYCTVNFDLNGAVGYESSKTIMTGSRYGELPASARFGYGLVGWFTEPEGGTQITSDTICDITGNITLYAHWEKRKVLEGKCGDNITYTLGGDGVLHLSGYGEMKTHPWTETHKDIVLEVTTEGEITTICEDAFADCVWLQSVEFPSTLKSIEKNAFKGDYNLKIDTLRLPEGLASIGAYAFNGCKGIGGLELPTTLTSVDQAAFSGCSGLTGALDLSHITYFGNYAFAYCTGITEITIPVELRYYRSNASGSGGTSIFEGTKNVEKIHYVKQADGIMIDRQSSYTDAVGYYKYTLEYQSNGSLKEIVFDEGITRIGNYAYYHIATGEYGFLEKNTLPSTLTSIGDYAFAYQKGSNVSIEFPDGLNSIGKSAFAGFTGLTAKDLYLPSSLKSVADGAFSGCSGLTGALDLSHITYFGNYAFAYCTGITEITIPVELRYYRSNASGSGGTSIFEGTKNVEKIHYVKQANGIMIDRQSSYTDAVGYYEYTLEYQCRNSLKEIIFDEGITYIGNYAYNNNTVLVNALLPKSLTSVGTNNFSKINKSNAVFYGYKDTYGEQYSNSLNVKFIPLEYPLFSDDNPGKVFRGRTVRLDGRVYTGIGIYNDNVEWSLSGQSSEETVLDENGNLYVSMDETSEEITVTIKYGEYSSELILPVSTAKEVEITSASIALKDKIGVNFYLYMNEDDVDDLTVNLKFNGEVISIPASEGVKKTYSGRKVRVFTVDTVARQMRDQIVLTVTDSDGYTATLTRDDQDYTDTGYPYRVVDYFAAAQEAGVTGKLGDLLEKMNNYGKYAQIQFKHNVTDEVRNTKPVDDVTLEDLDDYAARAGGEVEGIAYTSGSLELNSAISFRTYFELQEGYDISSYTFTVDGNTVTPTLKASSNSYYVSVLGIPARALGDEHTITVSDGTDTITVKYCALSYAYSVVSSDAAPDTLKNLCKAIYLYGDAAKTYFTN